ncbi:amino acid ABC transporter ATP-binding protein [Poseidonibacter lekithochrous]|uniref:amino acid ABC transporter ATP-binding protein n=1 Tax=Poseidonibacter TaxID=2321187 RepID=UPI001C09EF41|nr:MULTISPECIES: amino acid ABC transporter ATP-binding protein [Poseidonibacter]MBU3013915.1 amino acid ABC transporter ATP-binding protein [Poseidonibacter lekithochrous]MDO6827210.1 amino acid ABC transporter ATP-binding protein [Poseidonibacter sp. 1_MG-2023]
MSLVNIEGLHKYYGEKHVLKGVDLKVKAGEVISIIGRSGSGKSTLLRCINGLENHQEGNIIVGNLEVTTNDLQLQKISKVCGMIFQGFNLYPHKTTGENVMLSPKLVLGEKDKEAREIALKCLKKVGMDEFFDQYPGSLSGGQKQRVAIARSLAMSPKVLLCDEITSALDPELVGEVLKVLEELAKEGITLILVTHEMNFARDIGDRVIFMHNGKVWETGPSDEVFANPKTTELQNFLSSVL